MDQEWWSTIDQFEKIFWIIAIPSSVAMVIQLVMTVIGADSELDADIDTEIEADTGAAFQFFTLKNLIAFFTIFAWTGIACQEAHLGKFATLSIAFVAGLLMMGVMTTLFYFISKLTHSGSLDLNNALGHTGEAYLTIPPSKSGYGKIQIKIQGALRDMDAMTDDETEIKTGSLIKVVEVTDNNLIIVSKIK